MIETVELLQRWANARISHRRANLAMKMWIRLAFLQSCELWTDDSRLMHLDQAAVLVEKKEHTPVLSVTEFDWARLDWNTSRLK